MKKDQLYLLEATHRLSTIINIAKKKILQWSSSNWTKQRKLNVLCVAYDNIWCIKAVVVEIMDIRKLKQISLEIFQFKKTSIMSMKLWSYSSCFSLHTYLLLTVLIEEADVLEACALEVDVLAALVLLWKVPG
jgi:hypothetical protein